MLQTGTIPFRILMMVVLLAGCPQTWAQQPVAAEPPVPADIVAAKKVFISNGGVDATFAVAFEGTIGANEPYRQFYFALKSWGRYELVDRPAAADLVLQLRFSAPFFSCQTYRPQLALAILDTKTRFVLWTLTKPVRDEAHLNESIANLVDDLKRLGSQPTIAKR